MDRYLGRFQETFYALMRFVVGFLFAFHGLQKMFGMYGGTVQPTLSLLWFAGLIELVAGPLVAVGLLTVPMAFLASGQMAVAYFMSHQPAGFWPVQNRGELAAIYCFVFLFIAARGAGRFSLDAMLGRGGRSAAGARLR